MAASVGGAVPSADPVEISRINDHDVRILWKDGHVSDFPARYLRLKCVCAMCVHEMTGEVLVNPKVVAADVHPDRIEAVGRYAVQIYWSDGHASGIYAYDRLRRMCPCGSCAKT